MYSGKHIRTLIYHEVAGSIPASGTNQLKTTIMNDFIESIMQLSMIDRFFVILLLAIFAVSLSGLIIFASRLFIGAIKFRKQ